MLERLAALEAHLKAIENLVGDLYDNSETRATGYVTRLTAPINKLTARIEELENAPDVEADMEALSPRVLAAEQGVLAAERTLNETREHLNSVHAFFTAELTDIRKTISSGPEKHTVSDLHARLDGVEAEFRKYSRLSNIPPPYPSHSASPLTGRLQGTACHLGRGWVHCPLRGESSCTQQTPSRGGRWRLCTKACTSGERSCWPKHSADSRLTHRAP